MEQTTEDVAFQINGSGLEKLMEEPTAIESFISYSSKKIKLYLLQEQHILPLSKTEQVAKKSEADRMEAKIIHIVDDKILKKTNKNGAYIFKGQSGDLFCVRTVVEAYGLEKQPVYIVGIMKPEGFWTFVQEDWQIYMICLLVYAVVLIIIAYMYGNRVARPLQELVSNIGKITDGYLGETFSMNSYMEIEEVVDSINHMMAKLEQLESSRQEFVSNVSHELKTPITSVKVLADSLLQQEDAPAELYREFLTDINEEIERENKIITDLLSLVKMDKTAGELNISSVNINELCEQIIKRMKPIANKRNISLIFEAYRPIMADVDEVKLSLAINNLIENAVKYNYDEGWVRVSLNTDHKFFYIKVSDSGVGIPADEQENVFERFYRVDKARSRETGGTGLGLAITRNAILMHRGAIKIYSKEKEGTTFTVRIPITYANT